VIHGALNITSGHVEFLITDHWTAATYQAFLRQVRQAWRGWHIVLFIDRGSPHTAQASRGLATALGIEVRWLPTATPKLNACEGLWRGAKGSGLANRASQSIDEAADAACRYLLDLTPRQRLQLAGVLSGYFWLSTYPNEFPLHVEFYRNVGSQFDTARLCPLSNHEMQNIFFFEVKHLWLLHCRANLPSPPQPPLCQL
jgi:hypothetical protein